MDTGTDGCRLCLDSFVECFTTIDNPQLKHQMEKVFCFSIDRKPGYCSRVCQSCAYAISEFYQYSEKVRLNQEFLYGNVKKCNPIIDTKDTLESVKVETPSYSVKNLKDALESVKVEIDTYSVLPGTTDNACQPKNELSEEAGSTLDSKATIKHVKIEMISDSGLLKTTEDVCEPNNEFSGKEEDSNSDHEESNELPPKMSQIKRKRYSKKRKLADLDPTKYSKQIIMKTQQERNEEDQLFNKHFSMICDICETSTANFTELVSHFRTAHNRRYGYVVCCKKKLIKRGAMRDHIVFHANPDAFRCKECGNKYNSKDNLNTHMFSKHSSSGPFKCDHCPQSFDKEVALAKHIKRHVKVRCPICKKIFAGKNSLSTHITRIHRANDRTVVCDTCGKGFLSQRYLDRHMNEHNGIGVQRIQCGICQRWLKGKRNFRDHMNVVHSDGKQEFQCDICLQKYPHQRALHVHKLKAHSEPKFECEVCGRKFKKRSSLNDHRTSHTGEVLYTCDYCGIPFNSTRILDEHVRTEHPTEWTQKKLSGPSGK